MSNLLAKLSSGWYRQSAAHPCPSVPGFNGGPNSRRSDSGESPHSSKMFLRMKSGWVLTFQISTRTSSGSPALIVLRFGINRTSICILSASWVRVFPKAVGSSIPSVRNKSTTSRKKQQVLIFCSHPHSFDTRSGALCPICRETGKLPRCQNQLDGLLVNQELRWLLLSFSMSDSARKPFIFSRD